MAKKSKKVVKDDPFLDIIKGVDPNYEEVEIITTGFLDTGSYALNALLSGSIYGGLPNNRTSMFAGDPSTGKTYLTLSVVKHWMDEIPEARILWFDTEFALDREMLERRGIDASRFYIQQPDTLQEFRTKALKILEDYDGMSERPPLMMVLDSLGNLPTAKEVEDSLSGSETRDMTKAQIIKSIFRLLTLKLGKLGVPMVICNHTYDSMSAYTPKEISGGSGSKYASSTVVTLSRSKEKDGDVVVGNIIRATTYKSRYSKEHQQVELELNFDTGLDKYYGLLDMAESAGIFKKVGNKYELPDGSTEFKKTINGNPRKFYTKEVLDRIDAFAKERYGLGTGFIHTNVDADGEDE